MLWAPRNWDSYYFFFFFFNKLDRHLPLPSTLWFYPTLVCLFDPCSFYPAALFSLPWHVVLKRQWRRICCQNPISPLKDRWTDKQVVQSIVHQKCSNPLRPQLWLPIRYFSLSRAAIRGSGSATVAAIPSAPLLLLLMLSGWTAHFEWHVISGVVTCVPFHLRSRLQGFKQGPV